ncbi:hypothetical protein Lal_00024831 [Lupinus albus]|uniref:Putative E3 ubiquitin-protein ligase MARCH n=1 Tax=Lupinus albus TaxID=3870 RepID=A0A6A5NNQ4_LUPAL|nr:putative E3 ubiquitin-protein ligase MARCH [Lupinus albus]KAF1889504.1 hypothetical protein Lal_00024831 [Lupinus albus]
MSDHLVLFVDRLLCPVPVDPVAQPPQLPSDPSPSPPPSQAEDAVAGPSESAPPVNHDDEAESENGEGGDEEDPLIQMGECRICQEEDGVSNLESPCACSGSLKYAHRKCVQHWCNEKGDITCEICHQPYQSGYTAPPPRLNPDETTIDIGGWTISGTPLDLSDPRLLAIAEAERQFLDAEYDEYAASNASGAAFCRSAALILMALLILRHALSVTDGGDSSEDDPSNFFSLFLLRAAGFLLPCYIMAWAISVLQRRRQRQEAAALAATQVAFVLQSGQRRGLQFGIPPGPTVHPEQA